MSKYLAEVKGDSKVLRGPVEMEKPVTPKASDQSEYEILKKEYSRLMYHYNKHISSLPVAFENVEWLTEADNGRLLEEGVDFKVVCWLCEAGEPYYGHVADNIAVPIDKQGFPNSLADAIKTQEQADNFMTLLKANGDKQEGKPEDYTKSIEGDYVFNSNEWRATYAGDVLVIHKREKIF